MEKWKPQRCFLSAPLPASPTPGGHGGPGGYLGASYLHGGGTGTWPLPLASWGMEPGAGEARGCGKAGRLRAAGIGLRSAALTGFPPTLVSVPRQTRPKPGGSLYPPPLFHALGPTAPIASPKTLRTSPPLERATTETSPPHAAHCPLALQCPRTPPPKLQTRQLLGDWGGRSVGRAKTPR